MTQTGPTPTLAVLTPTTPGPERTARMQALLAAANEGSFVHLTINGQDVITATATDDGRQLTDFHVNAAWVNPEHTDPAPALVLARQHATRLLNGELLTGAGTMGDLAAHGYITDEWDAWQRGGCAAYALALIERFPRLRFASLGEVFAMDGSVDEGWGERHYFAHDDEYAYDSAGRHPLPYMGVWNDCNYCEYESDPGDFGYPEPGDAELIPRAHAHIERHHIGPDTV